MRCPFPFPDGEANEEGNTSPFSVSSPMTLSRWFKGNFSPLASARQQMTFPFPFQNEVGGMVDKENPAAERSERGNTSPLSRWIKGNTCSSAHDPGVQTQRTTPPLHTVGEGQGLLRRMFKVFSSESLSDKDHSKVPNSSTKSSRLTLENLHLHCSGGHAAADGRSIMV